MKSIKDFEELYAITLEGGVYSHRNNIFLSHSVDKKGYHRVTLYNSGESKTNLVHRLVALAYLTNPDNLPEVNHIDGNKSNNHYRNLEWVTSSQNNQHAVDTGLRGDTRTYSTEVALRVLQYVIDGWRDCDIIKSLGIPKGAVKLITQEKSYEEERATVKWADRQMRTGACSTQKVIRICEMLQDKHSYQEISTATNITKKKISNIKNRVCFVKISSSYIF
jgi:hypothetical protein